VLHSPENPPSTATTGVEELDRALNGLYWGDNVVFDAELAVDVEPFFAAVAARAGRYEGAAFVTLEREPEDLARAFPGFQIIDARPGTPLAQPAPLLDAVARHCVGSPRQLILFDTLEAMSSRWGRETAGRFFARCCPLLLGLGAIAYWSLTAARHTPALRRKIESITQCVIDVGDGRLRIAKAEGRPPGVEGSVFRYALEDDRPVLEAAPAAARLGAALRGLRVSRHLSQADLARLAGVSPSAISTSQASSTSRWTSSCGVTWRRATGSPAATTRASPRAIAQPRCSTTPGRACAPTSCGSPPAARRRPTSPTRASSSSRSLLASCRCCSPPAARCCARARP